MRLSSEFEVEIYIHLDAAGEQLLVDELDGRNISDIERGRKTRAPGDDSSDPALAVDDNRARISRLRECLEFGVVAEGSQLHRDIGTAVIPVVSDEGVNVIDATGG